MDHSRLSGTARPGDVLGGRYQLEELIGEGGMGSVWRASDQILERSAAVKVFAPGVAAEADAVRRDSEKRLLASVSHPSLVTLFDAHLADDETSYLVMEYIDGGTLSTLIERGPVAPRDAASVATDLGEALHVIHTAGIIHRDIKPANILLRPPLTADHTFRAVLADFGIAYIADSTRVTTPGTAVGTAAYISPEQVRGRAPGPASDIYSLGLVLLEALSGARAFPARTPIEAISVRLTASPEVPGDWGHGWRSLLTAMTALDPDERPTALEVSQRGRALDNDHAEPQVTVPVAVAAAPADEHTRVLPVDPGNPTPSATSLDETALIGAASVVSAASAPAMRRNTRTGGAPTARRRRSGFIGAGILAVAGSAVALAVWAGVSASAPPTDAPQVEQPTPTPSSSAPTIVPEPAPTTAPVVEDTPATDPVTDSGVEPVTEPVPGPGTETAPATGTGGDTGTEVAPTEGTSGPGNGNGNSGNGNGGNGSNGNGNGNNGNGNGNGG